MAIAPLITRHLQCTRTSLFSHSTGLCARANANMLAISLTKENTRQSHLDILMNPQAALMIARIYLKDYLPHLFTLTLATFGVWTSECCWNIIFTLFLMLSLEWEKWIRVCNKKPGIPKRFLKAINQTIKQILHMFALHNLFSSTQNLWDPAAKLQEKLIHTDLATHPLLQKLPWHTTLLDSISGFLDGHRISRPPTKFS